MAFALAEHIRTAPTSRRPTPSAATRDGGIDLVRAVCVVVVVLLHALMAGVVVDASGPVFVNTADGAAWFAPLTWAVQIMPVFFVIGGFAGALAYRRSRERGGTAVGFVAARTHRLLVPAILAIAAAGVALGMLTVAGVPADLVHIAGFRYSQPLWFLGVFLLCQALLPALVAAHDRAPVRSILALAGAAVLVDVARAATGIDAIGFLNLAFVWLTMQQLGFFLADGRIDALRARTRALAGAGAVAVLVATFVTGVYSPDLFENLNPPTVALVLVGVAQTVLVSLARAPLAALSRRPRVAAFTEFVTARTMTIYLWHMPVLLTMAGVTAMVALAAGFELPAPSSPQWWLTRPVWLAVAIALTALVAVALSKAERRRLARPTRSPALVAHAVVLGLAGVVLLLAGGTSVLTAALAVALVAVALARVSGRREAASRPLSDPAR